MTLLKPLILFYKIGDAKKNPNFYQSFLEEIFFNKKLFDLVKTLSYFLLNILSKIDQSLMKIGELFVKKNFIRILIIF